MVWLLPSHHSEAARCASTEDHQAPFPPLLCEQEGHLAGLSCTARIKFRRLLLSIPLEGPLERLPLRPSNEHILIVRVPGAQEPP